MEKIFKILGYTTTAVLTFANMGIGIEENLKNGELGSEIFTDALIDVGSGALSITVTAVLAGTGISPGWGTLIGLGIGLLYDYVLAPRFLDPR